MWILAANPAAIIIFFIAVFLSLTIGIGIGNIFTLATLQLQLFRLSVVVRRDEYAHARAEAAVTVAVAGAIFTKDFEPTPYVRILKRLRCGLCLMHRDIVHEDSPSVASRHHDVLRASLAPVDSTVVITKVFQCLELLRFGLCPAQDMKHEKWQKNRRYRQ